MASTITHIGLEIFDRVKKCLCASRFTSPRLIKLQSANWFLFLLFPFNSSWFWRFDVESLVADERSIDVAICPSDWQTRNKMLVNAPSTMLLEGKIGYPRSLTIHP
jgi:hypothetical protein